MFLIFTTCTFYGMEFKSLGRHTWRCKENLKNAGNSNNGSNNLNNALRNTLSMEIDGSEDASNCSKVKYCCRKHCNGLCCLKLHQRSCRVIKDIGSETFEILEQSDFTETGQVLSVDSLLNIKPDIKVPNSDDQWKLANDYFAASMPMSS